MQDTNVPQPDPRAELIAGLRALADFYETHPDVPLPPFPDLAHCALTDDDAEGIAEVTAVAEALGVPVEIRAGSANAERRFAGLRFRVYSVSRQRSAAWDALTSYNGAVQPEGGAS